MGANTEHIRRNGYENFHFPLFRWLEGAAQMLLGAQLKPRGRLYAKVYNGSGCW